MARAQISLGVAPHGSHVLNADRPYFNLVHMEIYMKRSLAIAVGTVALLAAGMPLAQDAKAPASTPSPTAAQSGSSMNMSNQMDEHMQKMKVLHEKMTSAATPEERQVVMDEQRQEMQAGMGMMNQMMQGGGMKGQKDKPDATSQMQMMQGRMDMMQMMMQTMMDHQVSMTSPKSLAAAPKK